MADLAITAWCSRYPTYKVPWRPVGAMVEGLAVGGSALAYPVWLPAHGGRQLASPPEPQVGHSSMQVGIVKTTYLSEREA
jgi:hypothetical protein